MRFYIVIQLGGNSLSQVLHFLISMSQTWRTFMSANEVLMKNLGIFLVLYYCFKKASKPLPNKGEVSKRRKVDLHPFCSA